MAAVLKCPDCGHRHPLSEVTTREVFRCHQCGRALKVPESLRTKVPDQPASARPVGSGATARAMPAQGPGTKLLPSLHADAPEAALAPLGWGWRLLIWAIGVPVGAIGGGLLANALGLVTISQLEDTMLGSGYRRYDPLIRFVPLWALVTALFVTAVIATVEALRRRRVERGVRSTAEPDAGKRERAELDADRSETSPRRSRADADTEPSAAVEAGGDTEPEVGADSPTEKIVGTSRPDEVARSEAD